jgi:hypothetical protein
LRKALARAAWTFSKSNGSDAAPSGARRVFT